MNLFVFLDIDGVINHGSGPPDAENVACLNQITDATGAKIVIHSSRRYFMTLEQLREVLVGAGVTAEIIDVAPYPKFSPTPQGIYVPDESFRDFVQGTGLSYWPTSERPSAVLHWLKANLVDGFVILDDAPDFQGTALESLFVQTESHLGLTAQDVQKAIQILAVNAEPF